MAETVRRTLSRVSLAMLAAAAGLLIVVLIGDEAASPALSVAPSSSASPAATPSAPLLALAGGRPRGAGTQNVYAATTGAVRADLRDVPHRVYVPNERSNTVSVIDPATMKVVREITVGAFPQHITPSPDLAHLYVNDEGLTELDPRTGDVTRRIPIAKPYNLYFTMDGRHAVVVAEDLDRLDLYAYPEWTFERSVAISWKGVDHMDMSADGSFLIATTEYSGVIVKVDVRDAAVTATEKIGVFPVDVRLSPDGSRFYVSDQGRHGVIVVDPVSLSEIGFIPTGRGAHGLAISRDTRSLYVSDRLEGTIAVIDMATDRVTARWNVGGSPDMLQVSSDGRQLWTGDRFGDSVVVIDTATGAVITRIKVGRAPHGLTYFPQPGSISLGHNGVYR